ncbi:GID complex subunit 4, VID24 [Entomortierella beljakovae]|nr:GID complex subunit 4, VID24 [Entomortierella beljakovae]
MPVFTQICSAEPVTETTVILATCTCACLSETEVFNGSSENISSNLTGELFIRIEGVIHWSTCALYANALSSGGQLNLSGDLGSKSAAAMTLIKQQQQQKIIGGLAVLRKPPVSSFSLKNDPFAPRRLAPSRTSHLYAGSRFRGKQKSGLVSYDVMVDIKMIGDAHSFVTKKWDVDLKTDQEHWARFKSFEPIMDTFATEKFKYDFRDKDVIFMRWKEHFLVPDHRVVGITGASFAGFYYICYNKSTGEIDGYYYHNMSEKFQNLMLTHVQDEPMSYGSFEFR